MARTKQEVRDYLNTLIGLMVNEKCGIYNGQCVSLIKALLEFLGAPNPYAGRGNATDVGDTLIRQGLAKNSAGWLNVCVNHDMGRIFENGVWNNYGHIWLDLSGEMNFEQNGNKALRTTKNTRPISQAQQIVNLDQYIIEEDDEMVNTTDEAAELIRGVFKREPSTDEINSMLGRDWKERIVYLRTSQAGQQVAAMVNTFPQLSKQASDLNTQVVQLNQMLKDLQDRPTKQQLEAAIKLAEDAQKASDALVAKNKELEDEKAAAEKTGNAFTRWLGEQLNKILGKS